MKYKYFGHGTGLKVSEIALGCGNFGQKWGYGADAETARAMFNLYAEQGGNFIDTADNYQLGESEELLGSLLTGRRDDFVLASKFTLGGIGSGGATTGNSRRVMIASLEASLKRLKTDRIDIYWVHMPDSATSSAEIMRGLDDLVTSGKINYIGFSDFPAWRVARAATIAEIRGWAPVIGIQMEYSLIERTPDRELIPMANGLGLGMVGWSPLAGGLLTGKYRRGEEGRATTFGRLIHAEDDERKKRVMDVLIEISTDSGVSPGEIALTWMGSRGVIPIIGPKSVEQLTENLAATNVVIGQSQIARLNAASAMPLGFPHEMLAEFSNKARIAGGNPEAIEEIKTPIA